LQRNETLLIHAVGSGVGLAALQLAKAKNIKTFGTSRTQEKLDKCRAFGIDEAILVSNEANFAETIKDKTKGKGVDVILDLVGANYFAANLESLALKGRLMLVGTVGGRTAELNFGLALAKRAKIIGTVLRSRSTEEKAEAAAQFSKKVVPLLEKGLIKPNIDRVFSIKDIRAAHEYLESNESFGKVILMVNGE
jgi:NADPH:quinone reductase-like Zn-dependent oxidoreductase